MNFAEVYNFSEDSLWCSKGLQILKYWPKLRLEKLLPSLSKKNSFFLSKWLLTILLAAYTAESTCTRNPANHAGSLRIAFPSNFSFGSPLDTFNLRLRVQKENEVVPQLVLFEILGAI